MKPLLLTLSLLRGADAYITVDLSNRYGGHEMNPFMPNNAKVIAGILVAETVMQTWALAKLNKHHPRVARVIAISSIVIEGFVVKHNIGQYR